MGDSKKVYKVVLTLLLVLPVAAALLMHVFYFGGSLGMQVGPNDYLFVPLKDGGHLTLDGVLAVAAGMVYAAVLALIVRTMRKSRRQPQTVAVDREAWPPAPEI